MKKQLLFLIILLVSMIGIQCTNSSKKKLVFAIVPKQLDNPVFNVAKIGAEDAAKELGDVEIFWTAPVVSDPAQQAAIIESLVARKVDGIAVSVIDPDAMKLAIDKAIEAGIPVVTFDSDAPKSKRISFYGTNNLESGKLMAECLVGSMGTKGNIAILTGYPGALNLEDRLRGATDYLEAYPDIKIISIQACYDDINKGTSQMENVMQSHPELKGWIMVGPWPLFTPPPGPFSNGKAGKITVISFDALQEELEYVRQGYVQTLVGQKIWEWGYHSVNTLHGIVKDKKIPQPYIDSGVDVITKKNVEEYAKKWKTMNFRDTTASFKK
jgi:ribose transport system substrate-binding protein